MKKMMGSNVKFISRCLATSFMILSHILLKMVSPMVLGWVFEASWIQVFLGHYSTFSVPQSKRDLFHLSKGKEYCCSAEVHSGSYLNKHQQVC